MKKGFLVLALMFAVMFSIQPVNAAELSAPGTGQSSIDATGDLTPATVYTVNVSFNKNGGRGVMSSQAVTSSPAATLKGSTFTRKDYIFNGWNTLKNGKGTSFADMADASSLATEATNGQTIVLYAQWKLKAPSISKLSAAAVSLTVKYKTNSKAAGYQIQYGTNSSFMDASVASAKKSASSKEIKGLTPGSTYYVQVRNYYKIGSTKIYSDWSRTKSVKTKQLPTIANTKSSATIESDVTLTGSGTGYHAKLVICTATSAVSYGIQYDAYAEAPYTGKAMAMVENVASNGSGGQQYSRPGNKSLKLGQTYHLMMTIDKNGNGSVYLDYQKIGTFYNGALTGQDLTLRVEGSGRINGDKVNAVFKNTKLKLGGNYYPDKGWTPHEFRTCPSIIATPKSDGSIVIKGSVSGLPAGGDWDNQYGIVSSIIQFIP